MCIHNNNNNKNNNNNNNNNNKKIIIIIIISLFQEGKILSKTAYLQYGLHKINKSIIQECQIINKSAKISKHAYISTQHLIIIMIVII